MAALEQLIESLRIMGGEGMVMHTLQVNIRRPNVPDSAVNDIRCRTPGRPIGQGERQMVSLKC